MLPLIFPSTVVHLLVSKTALSPVHPVAVAPLEKLSNVWFVNVAACPTYVIAPVDELIANLPSSFPAVIEYVNVLNDVSVLGSVADIVVTVAPLERLSATDTAVVVLKVGASLVSGSSVSSSSCSSTKSSYHVSGSSSTLSSVVGGGV